MTSVRNPSLLGPPSGHLSRRTFLKGALAGGLVVAGGGFLSWLEALAKVQAEYAMVIDTTKCVGCRACELACQERNHLAEGTSYIRILPKGTPENRWFLPVQCQHCQKPPCAEVCPTRATYIHETGVVLVNPRTCVGCRYCAVACPYGARTFDEKTGLVEKCWLCLDYVLGGGEPACVHACILGARLFGRRDDPASPVGELIASGKAKPLHPEFGTRPGILYYILPEGA